MTELTHLRRRANSLRMEYQLREILAAFKRADIRALVLKGLGLGYTIYADPAQRPASDIDLLVFPKQTKQARQIMFSLGYTCRVLNFDLFPDFQMEEVFIHPSPAKFAVEVHWDLDAFRGVNRRIDLEELFSRSIKAADFDTLHPVDALIHASVHALMTHYSEISLKWLEDIARLSQRLAVPQDWEALQERSTRWGFRLAVENGLKLAQSKFDFNLPESFRDFSKWPPPFPEDIKRWQDALGRHRNIFSMARVRGGFISFKHFLRFLLYAYFHLRSRRLTNN